MTSNDLININPEALSCTKQKWQLNDIIPINYIIYTHNFYINEMPRISAFQPESSKVISYSFGFWQGRYIFTNFIHRRKETLFLNSFIDSREVLTSVNIKIR